MAHTQKQLDAAWRLAVRVQRQQAKIAKIDERISGLMSTRITEEEKLADLIASASKIKP